MDLNEMNTWSNQEYFNMRLISAKCFPFIPLAINTKALSWRWNNLAYDSDTDFVTCTDPHPVSEKANLVSKKHAFRSIEKDVAIY